MSRTPLSKFSRLALTVPTITLFPRTKSRLILSAGTCSVRLPPVMLESTSTPFFAIACMLSKTTAEEPVPSNTMSNAPALLDDARNGFFRRVHISSANLVEQIRVQVRRGCAAERRYVEAAQAQHE